MKIRLLSDIHLEFERYDTNGNRLSSTVTKYQYFEVPVTDDEKETVLILAGDIGVINSKHTLVPFIEEMCDRFKDVIIILGNHEYYKSSLITGVEKLEKLVEHTSCYVLNDSKVKINDVTFLGCTMWTDFKNGDPGVMVVARHTMNDYNHIRTGTFSDPYLRKVNPNDFYNAHETSKAYLENELYNIKIRDGEKAVVITHHLPSFKSVNAIYHGDNMNYCYYSDLDGIMADYSPDLWVHGHTHNSCDYVQYSTRVVCNPRGYRPSDLNPDFNPTLTLDI